MGAEPTSANRTNRARTDFLARMLADRRASLVNAVHGKIRDTRANDSRRRDVFDSGESSGVDIQEDIEFALIQLKTETVNQIDAALRRLQQGNYGDCDECGGEIAEARLLALPFAMRCKHCEEARELIDQRERARVQRREAVGLSLDPP